MSEDGKTPFMRVPPAVYDDQQFCKKYTIERELGMGASGVVVCARHLELEERVAIKFLLSERDDPLALARFRREARAANRVKNDHVVRIKDVSTTDGGVPYVVMEYLEGCDLERMLLDLRDRQLPVRDAIEFVLQACEGLAECHVNGIVHRDLKPSNLFCTHGADGLPLIKLLDFGISKLGAATVDGAMTGRHAIIGSPRYMSPEQFDAPAEVDARTDIWALGVILYELVTGEAPFGGNTLLAIWDSVRRREPTALTELRRDAPLGLAPVVARCLEKDRTARFPNVAELAKALLPLAPERSRASVARIVRIIESPGVTTESLSLPRSRPPSGSATAVSVRAEGQSSRKAWRLVLGAIALGTVALVVVLRNREPPEPAAHVSAAKPGGGEPHAAERATTTNVDQARTLTPTASGTPTSSAASAASGALAVTRPTVEPRGPVSTSSAVVAQSPTTPAPNAATPNAAVRHESSLSAARHTAPPQASAPRSVASAGPSGSAEPVAARDSAARAVAALPTSAPSDSARSAAPAFIVDVVEQRKAK
jgi:serine/threonine-protein kinase